MDPIRIETDIQSTLSQKEVLTQLAFAHFTQYDKIHKMAKEDNQAVPIDLLFGEKSGDDFNPLQWEEGEEEIVSEILSVLSKKQQVIPGEYTKAEISFFATACKKQELKEDVQTWLIRISTYNFGVYSRTLQYPDLTPVGFWAAFFFALNYPEDMNIFINYLSSLNMINYTKRKWYDDEKLKGFEFPVAVSAIFYLYRYFSWNKNTIQLLCVQLANYAWSIPEMFIPLLKECNPAAYLEEEENFTFFISTYREFQKAHKYDWSSDDASIVIEEIFPCFIDGDRLDSIKLKLLEELK